MTDSVHPHLLAQHLEARPARLRVLAEISDEHTRQEQLFPGQHLPDDTGDEMSRRNAELVHIAAARRIRDGNHTWRYVLAEEYFGALAETDQARLRMHLVRVAAAAVRWIEDIDQRAATTEEPA